MSKLTADGSQLIGEDGKIFGHSQWDQAIEVPLIDFDTLEFLVEPMCTIRKCLKRGSWMGRPHECDAFKKDHLHTYNGRGEDGKDRRSTVAAYPPEELVTPIKERVNKTLRVLAHRRAIRGWAPPGYTGGKAVICTLAEYSCEVPVLPTFITLARMNKQKKSAPDELQEARDNLRDEMRLHFRWRNETTEMIEDRGREILNELNILETRWNEIYLTLQQLPSPVLGR